MERITNSHRAAASQRESSIFSLYLESLFPILRSYLLQLYIGRSLPDLPLDLIKSGLYYAVFLDRRRVTSTQYDTKKHKQTTWYVVFHGIIFLIKPITK